MTRSVSKLRLGGGADVDDVADDAGGKDDEAEADQVEAGASSDQLEQDKENIQRPLSSTGDPRVDEMLDCALENLEQASKALMNLGENLEHELKLFLIELMGRARKWTRQVDSKLEWTKNDILELHKELATNMAALKESRRESVMLQNKLMNSDVQKASAQTETAGLIPQQKSNMALTASPSRVQSSRLGPCADNTDDTCQDSQYNEQERLQMCLAELECEVVELRKENQRIVKERAEYENAIQRALLKGVSSLNVEALKVLRCTPIQNCGSPCQGSTSVEPARTSSRECPGKSNRGHSDGRNCMNASSNDSSDTVNGDCGTRVCPKSSGRRDRKSRKSRDNNMLLLLHQKDAENFGIQSNSKQCDNPSSKKRSSQYPSSSCEKYKKSNYTC